MTHNIHAENAPFDGRWWTSDEPDHVVGGRLALVDGVWRLTLLGWLGKWEWRDRLHERPAVIYGEVGTTAVTLLDMVPGGYEAKNHEAPHRSDVAANQIVIGAHTDGSTRFRQASVRLLNLNEFTRRWVFNTETEGFAHAAPGESRFRDTFVYTDPGVLQAQLPEAILSLARGQAHSVNDLSSVSVTSDEWAIFDFSQPRSLEEIGHDYLRPLASLLRLASCEPCPILRLEVVPDGADEVDDHWSLLAWEHREPVPPPGRWFEFIFTLANVEFAAVVARWWELQPDIALVTDLLSTLESSAPSSNKFLNAASAIEAYHRRIADGTSPSVEHTERLKRIKDGLSAADRVWLSEQLAHSHEPTFVRRIQAVVERAGLLFPPVIGNVEAWAKWVKLARNSVAHRDPDMIDIEKEWRTTVRITATIQWLMRLVLLHDLQIPDEIIAEGVRQQRGLEWAGTFLKQQKPDWFGVPMQAREQNRMLPYSLKLDN